MQKQLQQIYEDVLARKITKDQALAMIRALKQGQAGAALMVPDWQPAPLGERSEQVYAEHVVILCGTTAANTGELATLIPASRCLLWPAPVAPQLAQAYRQHGADCFELVQAMLGSRPHGKLLLQLVLADDAETALLAGLAGMFRTAALENPRFAGQVITVEAAIGTTALARLLGAEAAVPQESPVRHRHGVRQVQRWSMAASAAPSPALTLKEDGVYLITGGLGALGRLLAADILRQTGRARVVLAGRGAATAATGEVLRQLDGPGTRLSYRQVDLEAPHSVRSLVDGITREHGHLDGIVHAAGMIADSYLLKKTRAQFDAVLAPKVSGTVNLALACDHLALDFLVLFSSIAGPMGNASQADYAAANGFMDQFAGYRNARLAAQGRGGRTLALDWSLWQDGGMHIDATVMQAITERTGMRPLSSAAALQAFHHSLSLATSQCLIAAGEPARLLRWLAGPLPDAPAAAAPALAAGAAAPGAGAVLTEQAERYLCRLLAGVLKMAPQQIDVKAQLDHYGIDSIVAMGLTAELEKVFGPLSKTLFFEYQTIAELAEFMVQAHGPRFGELIAAPAQAPAQAPAPRAAATAPPARQPGAAPSAARHGAIPAAAPAESVKEMAKEAIAIVGLSGRYPQARDLTAFWDNLRAGTDCVTEVPESRWNWREHYSADRTEPGRHYSRWGGFISGVDEFDALFFNIPPREAKFIDPQERLFLEQAWMALEDAGYTRAALEAPAPGQGPGEAGEAGVYVGVMYSEYQLFGVEASMRGAPMALNGSIASIANRVSYFLNLHGPSMTLDTMCSSSLTAIHLACQDLRSGRTSLALAGGVNVTVHPNKYLMLSSGQFISSDGQCQSFGEGGNGYIPGEGVGVVVLKRLSDALRDGCHIHGLIRGSALSHGGRTNGYSVPNPRAQANAIRRALDDAGVAPEQVSYIEAHGTGTRLGDPIEMAALNAVFPVTDGQSGACPIGSVKSNIGHCESAAGIAALTKVLLQMKHGQIVPSLHSARLNPHIDFASSRFTVNQSLTAWERPRGGRRIAGISSFGAGGSNAHLVVEQYERNMQGAAGAGPLAIVLSARTAAQLDDRARALLAHISAAMEGGAAPDLAAVAYTLQVGREAMDERLGLLVEDAASLVGKLSAYLAGEQEGAGMYRGHARRNREALSMFGSDGDLQRLLRQWCEEGKVAQLLELWGRGVDLDWSALYGAGTPGRVSLPGYPFARERHWIEAAPRAAGATAHVLSQLLHRNSSTLGQHRYSSVFGGHEYFFDQGRLVPAAALAMAAAAMASAQPEQDLPALELREAVWAQEQFAAAPGKALHIALTADGAQVDIEFYSGAGTQEVVHGQVRAQRLAVSPQQVDVAQLRTRLGQGACAADAAELLVPLALAGDSGDADGQALQALDSALRAAATLVAPAGALASIALVRLAGSCAAGCLAWIRQAPGGALDLDIINPDGVAAMVLRGVRFAAAGPAALPRTGAVPAPALPQAAPRLALAAPRVAPAAATAAPPLRAKPSAIALAAPAAARAAAGVVRSAPMVRPSIALAAPGASAVPAAPIAMTELGQGVFCLRADPAAAAIVDGDALARHWIDALGAVTVQPAARVLLLYGDANGFLFSSQRQPGPGPARRLYAALCGAALPIIAVAAGPATGAGFLAAAMCDFMLCNAEASYGYHGQLAGSVIDALDSAMLHQRFGAPLAAQLLREGAQSGQAWRGQLWSGPVLAPAELDQHALHLATGLAGQSQDALRMLKLHLAQPMAHLLGAGSAALAVAAPRTAGTGAPQVTVAHLAGAEAGVAAFIDTLAALFGGLEATSGAALVLVCDAGALGDEDSEALAAALERRIEGADFPVVTALPAGAGPAAWLFALLGDCCIYDQAAAYTVPLERLGAPLAQRMTALMTRRLGAVLATELMLTGAACPGARLQQAGAGVAVAADALQRTALALAESLATLAPGSMPAWRQGAAHGGAHGAAQGYSYSGAALPADTAAAPVVAGPVPTGSSVVSATAHADGVLVVTMADRQAKNMFSRELVEGLNAVFAHIAATPSYKVVVLTGYDTYFASGGTKEDLLAIQAGTVRFTDSRTFELALRCELPVIAAMQGHGIGAGWSLGMFADISLFCERSEYVSPYMKYGFTPGAGATLVFPEKIGHDLARETLLTAHQYTGRELRARALAHTVLHQDQVLPHAMALAHQAARLPRERLLRLKHQLAAPLRAAIDHTCQQELDMHARSFVGRGDTLQRIEERFLPAAPSAATAVPAGSALAGPALLARLKTLLAQELHMDEADIDDAVQFIDLGLDSVSGVTWVRKINQQYGTDIEATRIYSYPTLRQMAALVGQEITAPAAARAPGPDATPAPVAAVAAVATLAGPALLAELKTLLAQELHMDAADIDDSVQFIDLGLDSVSGVTWVRKINQQYGTDIEATRIYSYPTLKQLAGLVRQSMAAPASQAGVSAAVAASAAEPAMPLAAPAAAISTAQVTARLRTLLALELQMDEGDIDEAVQFVELGLDSVSGVTWIRKISEHYGIELEATQIYSYPTLRQLAAFVRRQLGEGEAGAVPVPALADAQPGQAGRPLAAHVAAGPAPLRLASRRGAPQAGAMLPVSLSAPVPVPAAAPAPAPQAHEGAAIAIIGMAGQFPKARDVDEFWRNIAAGRDCISEVPATRWDPGLYYQAGEAAEGKTNSCWMGALDDYDCFDPLFFNISPTEAECMDPQQRLFLETCWQALEHAGYDANALSGSACGVFAGCAGGDYHLDAASHRQSAQGFTGGASSILSARISYFLNLRGPSLAIDTACSSSLVAVASACDSLNGGRIDLALAGGVYVMAGPEMHIRTAQTGMLSTEGRCFTFDQRANGFVPGEAVATLVLKRLADAERDGDSILAVIRGWGVNQDGRTNGITAPNPEAQAALQRQVYDRFGIDPARIGLIEAHGTGTKLGDPLEVQALKESFGHYTKKQGYCALGSVKSNIGHCLTAAGATGLVKLIQALRHRQLPPTIQFSQLNEHIRLEGSPFFVNDRLQPWPAGEGARMAAVSSFGFSGTNAHIVVQEHVVAASARPAPVAGLSVVPLSAKSAAQLRERAVQLSAVLREQAPELAQLAYTLQIGRAAMDVRAAFAVSSIADLAQQLQAWLAGGALPVPAAGSAQEARMARWLAGEAVDWDGAQARAAGLRRLPLPGYPFARERYWIDGGTPPLPALAPPRASKAAEAAEAAEAAPIMVPAWAEQPLARRAACLFAEHVVILCGMHEVSSGELATLIPAGRCILWPDLPGLDVAQSYRARARAAFELMQAMLGQARPGPLLLQLVVADAPETALLAGLAPMLRTAALENPRFGGQVILAGAATTTTALARLLASEAAGAREPLVRHRPGTREVQRWQRATPPAAADAVAFKEHGVYLITGGLGALGQQFARHILRHSGRACIILTGRAAPGAASEALLRRLDGGSGRVTYRQLELEDLAAVKQVVAGVAGTHGQLSGILHAAGMTADNYIINKQPAEFDAVLAPKVSGTLNLALASEGLDLDFLALFSSIASVLGNAGQADYAAANGFMDQFAALRSADRGARGTRTLSLNWSLWQEGGMGVDDAVMASISALTGMQPLASAPALQAFGHSLALGAAQCLVVQGDLGRLAACLEEGPEQAPAVAAAAAAAAVAGTAGVDARLLAERTMRNMKQVFGVVIKLAPERIDERREFSAYGIDSLMVTRLNGEFAKTFGRIPKTLVFEYTTLAALSGYFLQHHRQQCVAWSGLEAEPAPVVLHAPAAPAPLPLPAPVRAAPGASAGPIAIVGLSGIFPQAASLAQFWENLRSGTDSVTEIPPVRWAQDGFYEADMMRAVELGKSYCKWGGFVDQFDQFDSLFFGIAPRDAMSMDPQERLFLQAAYHALEDAGYTRTDLREKFGRQVGVFAGITKQGFNLHGSDESRRERKFYPQTSFGSVANRLSYFLDLTGPSMPIDTMCSSSLTAVHEACEQIRRGECRLAFAGAVNLYTHPVNYTDMAAQYALSRDGRCRSFGVGANGFVPGEGAGVALLRPLADALADGDVIHGLILGTHVNHGGKTNGYTVPNPRAQADLVARAIEKAGIDARTISYIEAHGTGTELGDPIEIEGLRQAFARHTADTGFCRIGSAKSNIGHLEAAAGMAGISKIVLQMKHGQIVPSLHAAELNPGIDFDATPFVVNTALAPWEPRAPDGSALPRIAGISAFGAGGANAHVILKQYVAAEHPGHARPAYGERAALVPLSARTGEQLRELAARLLAQLEAQPAPALDQLAWTLQAGREAMDERVCFIASSCATLAAQLRAFIEGREADGMLAGAAGRAEGAVAGMLDDEGMQAAAATWLATQQLERLAQWWVRGLALDWAQLYPQGTPAKISLPGYPFARERYWPGQQPAAAPAMAASGPACNAALSKSIADIVNLVDSDAIGEEQACHLLDDMLRS